MCWSPAFRASGDGERRLLRPANWNYRPVADLDAFAKRPSNERRMVSRFAAAEKAGGALR